MRAGRPVQRNQTAVSDPAVHLFTLFFFICCEMLRLGSRQDGRGGWRCDQMRKKKRNKDWRSRSSQVGCRTGGQERKQQREGEETRRDRRVKAEEEETQK